MKKITIIMLAMATIFSTFAIIPQVSAESQVCGIDGKNYSSSAAAEAAGVEVSYDSSCRNVTTESGLTEETKDINFAGMLVEIGLTDLPTTIIVRDNGTKTDYTVNVSGNTLLGQKKDQATLLSDWIPGDQIKVIGKKNENTGTVDASILINASIKINENRAINGWITKIDKEAKKIYFNWANKESSFKYDEKTRFAAGGKNPASADDLKINDRIRARLLLRTGSEATAKTVIVLRRGADLFMKIRTFRPNATLIRVDSAIAPTTIQVKIEKTPGLNANDVNNTIGGEGSLVTVNVTEDTQIVRKYFGKTTLEEFSVGDKLNITGRANDDGTIDAKVLKNNSIWKVSTQGYPGVVNEVNANEGYLMVEWTPVKFLTQKKLKEKLKQTDDVVSAQAVSGDSPNQNLKDKIKNAIKEKIGKFTREIINKKVEIARISHEKAKIGDLIKRQPAKKIKVKINGNTKIVIGTNTNAAISDIQKGDKVRIRGTRISADNSVLAETIVVVNSLPEVENCLETPIDEVNEVVSEIKTDDASNSIAGNTENSTEEVIQEEKPANSDSSSEETNNNEAEDGLNGASENSNNGENPAN